MAANTPFQGHFSVRQGRKRKRNATQNFPSNLNSSSVFNSPTSYSIADGALALVVFPDCFGYHLQLVDKDKNYIRNTLCSTNEGVVQNIITFIDSKDFSGLIRYFQENFNSPPINTIIEYICRTISSPIFYFIVDDTFYLAVFQSWVGYYLQLVDKNNNYIENTFCFTNEGVVRKIITSIGSKDFNGLIRCFQENFSGRSINAIVEHVCRAISTPLVYSIVDGVLALAVFENCIGYYFQLIDKDKNYIENTFCFTNKDTVEKITLFIGDKNFSGLIRYLQGNVNFQSLNGIIKPIYKLMKELIFIEMSLPIVDLCPDPQLHSLSSECAIPPVQMPQTEMKLPPFSTFEETAEKGEQERLELKLLNNAVNAATVLYSGAQILSSGVSGSPVYQGLKLNIAVKKDPPGNAIALKPF